MHASVVGSENLDFLATLTETQRDSATQETKWNIVELKTRLNFKGISVSHSLEVQ